MKRLSIQEKFLEVREEFKAFYKIEMPKFPLVFEKNLEQTPESLTIDRTNQYIGKTVEWIMGLQEIVARKEQPAETTPPTHACAG